MLLHLPHTGQAQGKLILAQNAVQVCHIWFCLLCWSKAASSSVSCAGWLDNEPSRVTGRLEVRPAAELGPIIVCLDTSGPRSPHLYASPVPSCMLPLYPSVCFPCTLLYASPVPFCVLPLTQSFKHNRLVPSPLQCSASLRTLHTVLYRTQQKVADSIPATLNLHARRFPPPPPPPPPTPPPPRLLSLVSALAHQ